MQNYSLTKTCFKNLDSVYSYTSEKWSERQADSYLRKIHKNFRKLTDTPKIGLLRQYGSASFLSARVENHHAFYKETDDGIIIATVLHTKRDIDKIMNQISDSLIIEINDIERRKV